MYTYVALLAGRIENWRLGADGDNLRAAPYFMSGHADSPNFNRLFAAIYDIFFSKLTNMGRLIPSPGRTIRDIFMEKVHGTDKFLVSAELIAYLKWLIYVAAFKDRSSVQHDLYYQRELAKFSRSTQWRGMLFIVLDAWYKDFQPSKKRRSNNYRAVSVVDVDGVDDFKYIDNFVDPLAQPARAPGAGAAAGAGAEAGAAAGERAVDADGA